MPIDVIALIARIIFFFSGATLAIWTIDQALRSFVLPRSDRGFLTLNTFRIVYLIQAKRFRHGARFETKDRILAMLAPVAMFLLPLIWLALITVGYAGMYWGINPGLGFVDAIVLSGSSLMTLGFAFEDSLPMIILGLTQAALGMMLVALLIGYLPTMYGAFSQRETMVTKLETYAGTPPDPAEIIRRFDYIQMLDQPTDMREFWLDWQEWFVQIEETHTTLAAMNFFRSPKPDRHWVIAAGAILDTASLIASSLDVPRSLQAGIVIRSGYLSLRTVADYFQLPYDPDPQPSDPISISREEFLAVLDYLAESGLPVFDDRDACWDHFAGWRVNYDEVLIRLARITTAPYGIWSSDRAFEWLEADIPKAKESGIDRIREMRQKAPPPSEAVRRGTMD